MKQPEDALVIHGDRTDTTKDVAGEADAFVPSAPESLPHLTVPDLAPEASGISAKGKEMVKSGRIDKVKIDFILSKNLTAKRGAKNIYIRIQRPDQILLMKSEKDLFKFEDMKIPYSAMREVEYEGSELPVSIYWDNSRSAPLIGGKYTVDVFADGRNIGTTSFDVK